MEYFEKLKEFKIFDKLTDEEIEQIAGKMKIENVSSGEYIVREKDEGDEMYLLLEGKVQILKTTAYNDEYVCAEPESCENYIFGEMALLDEGTRSASIRAVEDSVVASLSAEDFKKFCSENVSAGYSMLWYLSGRVCGYLRKSNEDLMTVFQALLEEVEQD